MSLFTWNVDHYYSYYNNGVYYEYTQVWLCRLMVFIQYFSLQTSAWLLAYLCVDRFVTIMATPGSIYTKLPFSTTKTAFISSCCIVLLFAIINLHVLILNGYYDPPVLINVTVSELVDGKLINITKTELYQSPDTHCGNYITGFTIYFE